MSRGLGWTPEKESDRESYARQLLAPLGCQIEDRQGLSETSFDVRFPNGARFYFWPFTGWFQRLGEPGQGRGIHKMIRAACGTMVP